jgi:ligand-binding SRPBCC domain-containing protein
MMRGPIETRSFLNAEPAHVWARITTFEGINDEITPLFRMTAPARVRERGLDDVAIGRRICRSWVLLFGVLPVDFDDLTLVRLEPGVGFLEQSRMFSQRHWEHERTIAPAAGGCIVSDRIRYEPRIAMPVAFWRVLYTSVFRHRHRRLQRRFGGHSL